MKALVHRLFGRNIRSVSALTKQNQGGFPTKQWLDLCYNVEARELAIDVLSASEKETMKETYLTTNYLESSFSLLANVTNSANKPILQQLEGRVMTLDVIAAITSEINNNPKSGCVAIRSRKKRKLDEYSADDWNNAIEGCRKSSEEFHKKLRAKVKSALKNRASTRDMAGKSGKLGAVSTEL